MTEAGHVFRALALSQGFALHVIASPARTEADRFLEELVTVVGAAREEDVTIERADPYEAWRDEDDVVGRALGGTELLDFFNESRLTLPVAETRTRTLLVVDGTLASGIDAEAWKLLFRRLNEQRNGVVRAVGTDCLFLLPPWLEIALTREAPDFWSIRTTDAVLPGLPRVVDAAEDNVLERDISDELDALLARPSCRALQTELVPLLDAFRACVLDASAGEKLLGDATEAAMAVLEEVSQGRPGSAEAAAIIALPLARIAERAGLATLARLLFDHAASTEDARIIDRRVRIAATLGTVRCLAREGAIDQASRLLDDAATGGWDGDAWVPPLAYGPLGSAYALLGDTVRGDAYAELAEEARED